MSESNYNKIWENPSLFFKDESRIGFRKIVEPMFAEFREITHSHSIIADCLIEDYKIQVNLCSKLVKNHRDYNYSNKHERAFILILGRLIDSVMQSIRFHRSKILASDSYVATEWLIEMEIQATNIEKKSQNKKKDLKT